MIGALIGDIAAGTYEFDKDTFYRQLIPDGGGKVIPSVYGRALMTAASYNVINCKGISTEPLCSPADHIHYLGQWMMWQIVGAWTKSYEPKHMPYFHSVDKEEMYAQMFIHGLIGQLLNGATKSEAYHSVSSFEGLSKSWHWKENDKNIQEGTLMYIFRAWDSFYRGFDFTSTIHNAVKWSGDIHLIAAIAGAFADAMYGCNHSYIKKKYAKHGCISHDLNLLCYGEKFGYHHGLIYEMVKSDNSCRKFFAKNNAMTNVERHDWKECDVLIHQYFSKEERERILLAGPTSWDNRFGLYLDDGWIYCYRSEWLLSRFKLKKTDTNDYKISVMQMSGEMPFSDCVFGLCDALRETCYVKIDYRYVKLAEGLRYCLYYKGIKPDPVKTVWELSAFYAMEEMYYSERYVDEGQRKMWETDALTICMNDEGLAKYMKSDKIPLAVKGMLAFSIQDHLYHSPMGEGKIVYEYAKKVGEHYGI